jgi:hypothetical protein
MGLGIGWCTVLYCSLYMMEGANRILKTFSPTRNIAEWEEVTGFCAYVSELSFVSPTSRDTMLAAPALPSAMLSQRLGMTRSRVSSYAMTSTSPTPSSNTRHAARTASAPLLSWRIYNWLLAYKYVPGMTYPAFPSGQFFLLNSSRSRVT